MNEQTIILFFLIVSLGVTLSLYIFKAKKQMNYMGDERWEMIQLKSYRIASISTWLLIIVLLILPIFVDSQSTITIQRLTIFCLFYIGARNLLELSAVDTDVPPSGRTVELLPAFFIAVNILALTSSSQKYTLLHLQIPPKS